MGFNNQDGHTKSMGSSLQTQSPWVQSPNVPNEDWSTYDKCKILTSTCLHSLPQVCLPVCCRLRRVITQTKIGLSFPEIKSSLRKPSSLVFEMRPAATNFTPMPAGTRFFVLPFTVFHMYFSFRCLSRNRAIYYSGQMAWFTK